MTDRELVPEGVRKIVTLKNSSDLPFLQEVLNQFQGRIIKELPLVGGFLCELPVGEEALLSIRGYADKFEVEEDINLKLCCFPGLFHGFPQQGYLPGKPLPKENPYFGAQPQPVNPPRILDWGLKRVGAPEVWPKLKDQRVSVGIIDTGINDQHNDLRENFKDGLCTLDGQTSFLDDNGHGTHVAGIIAAHNAYGMVGINPYVDIYSVKAFDKSGNAKLSDVIEGLDWLMKNQVRIVNMSFSTHESSNNLKRAIQAAFQSGLVMVAAAGNDKGEVNYPARYPEVIAVSAINNQDQLASFSCTGPEIDFCAPGVDIKSTWVQGYAVKSGTSFAAPHITGAVTVLYNYYGPLYAYQVKEIMSREAQFLDDLSSEQQGAGLIVLPQLLH